MAVNTEEKKHQSPPVQGARDRRGMPMALAKRLAGAYSGRPLSASEQTEAFARLKERVQYNGGEIY